MMSNLNEAKDTPVFKKFFFVHIDLAKIFLVNN